MKLKYLLDTNILSELIKNPQGHLATKISTLENNSFCTSIIVACELLFGSEKKKSTVLTRRVKQLLENILIEPLNVGVDKHYAYIRNYLEQKGKIIGANDLLIAAQTLSLNLTLITANLAEFNRIPKLKVENWLASF